MMEGLRAYPKYRQCDLAWASRLPSHWGLPRLGSILEERRETNEAREIAQVLSVLKDIGVVPYEQKGNIGNKKSEDTRRYKIVRPDDLVMNSMNVIIGSVGRSRYIGCLSPVYYVLKRRFAEDDPRYLEAIFRVKPFQQSLVRIGNGILAHRMRIPMELLKCELLPKPPRDEQAAIVRFLGHANRRIDQFIRTKKKLIALLNEQKQTLIHRAVTRGLDPKVPMKDSGVPWLGEIPKHWDVRKIKQVARIGRGKFTHRPRNDPSLYGGNYPFIQTGAVARASRVISSYSQTLNEKGLAVSRLFRKGTLVMTIAANIGDVAILGFDSCFPDSIVAFEPRDTTRRDYLYLLFRVMKGELLREAPVNTQGNLNMERLGGLWVPLPPVDEQSAIAIRASEDTLPLDAAMEQAKREIELIREYRTRLIADVVTGQLDVREAVKSLPPDEPSAEDTNDMIENLDDGEEIGEDEEI